jgi:hypothetical protein
MLTIVVDNAGVRVLYSAMISHNVKTKSDVQRVLSFCWLKWHDDNSLIQISPIVRKLR